MFLTLNHICPNSMNSLTLLILPPLVRLFLSHLPIMKILRKMKLKLRKLVRTIQTKENLFQEQPLRQRSKRLENLKAIRLKIRSLNQRNRISVITMELWDSLVQPAISGQPLNKAIVCYHLVVKVKFHHLWVLLEIFLRLLCFFRT